ncbi:class I SAM-dependent methyltransferase [bacterium]|nr:class I SAM-dependent methyltransferase [bacterium]MBU1073257.1 class I SAM-dependent methyltransferase [bacterium]MBU1676498.1 class I SAM-dependent methyltransferase [bacterium]
MSFYAEFAAHYERVFPFREQVLSYLGRWLPPAPARILDAGCGPGHYCAKLADAGYEAVGLDLDEAMIAAARAGHPQAEFHVLDLRGVADLPGGLDGAFCLGNVAAHLSRAELSAVLTSLRGKLPAGAPWLVQTVNWDPLLDRDAYVFPDRELDGLVFQREYATLTRESAVFRTSLRRGDEILFAGEDVLHPLTSSDGIALHAAAGFELAAHHADFAGAPFAADRPGGSVMAFRKL